MKALSVNYGRLFNTGNYENEKVGLSLAVEEGQDPGQVLAEAKAWVNKQSTDHRDLDEEIRELRNQKSNLNWDVYRLTSQIQKMLQQAEQLNAILLAHGMQPSEILQNIVKEAQKDLANLEKKAQESEPEPDEDDDEDEDD